MKKTIVLVGMMGCGKTFIGKKLARNLGMDFIDGDDEIVKRLGVPITEIFEAKGEAYFRNVEYETTRDILSGEPVVLAVGGGAFVQEKTRREIQKNGISIWLKSDIEIILKRLKYDKSRPLLQTGDKRQKLLDLMEKRDPLYALADITITSDNNKAQPIIDEMIEKLKKYM